MDDKLGFYEDDIDDVELEFDEDDIDEDKIDLAQDKLEKFLEKRKPQKFSGSLDSLVLKKSREFCERKGITLNIFYEQCIIHEFQRIYKNDNELLIFKLSDDKEIIDYLKKIRIPNKKLDNKFEAYYKDGIFKNYLGIKHKCILEIVNKEFPKLPSKYRKILANCLFNDDSLINELLIKIK